MPAKPNTRTLVIADDDRPLRHLLVSMAERSGEFSVVCEAADGLAALDTIREALRSGAHEHDLFILTDLSMPRMDGIDLLRQLKGDPETRDVPVAIMTSSNRLNDREDARAAGCCAFFYKPERMDQFTSLIASLPQIMTCCESNGSFDAQDAAGARHAITFATLDSGSAATVPSPAHS